MLTPSEALEAVRYNFSKDANLLTARQGASAERAVFIEAKMRVLDDPQLSDLAAARCQRVNAVLENGGQSQLLIDTASTVQDAEWLDRLNPLLSSSIRKLGLACWKLARKGEFSNESAANPKIYNVFAADTLVFAALHGFMGRSKEASSFTLFRLSLNKLVYEMCGQPFAFSREEWKVLNHTITDQNLRRRTIARFIALGGRVPIDKIYQTVKSAAKVGEVAKKLS